MSTTTFTLTLIGLVCAATLLVLMYFGVPVPPWYVTIPVIVVIGTTLLLTVGCFLAKGDEAFEPDDTKKEDM